jgi:hypothetical protein
MDVVKAFEPWSYRIFNRRNSTGGKYIKNV